MRWKHQSACEAFAKSRLYGKTLRASLVAQTVKNLPSLQETQVRPLGREDPLEEGMATHASTLAWRLPRTEEPGGPQAMGSQRVGHNRMTHPFTPFPFTDRNHRLSSSPQASLTPAPQPSSSPSPCRTTLPPASVSAPLQPLDSSRPWSGGSWGSLFSSGASEHEMHQGSVPTAGPAAATLTGEVHL